MGRRHGIEKAGYRLLGGKVESGFTMVRKSEKKVFIIMEER